MEGYGRSAKDIADHSEKKDGVKNTKREQRESETQNTRTQHAYMACTHTHQMTFDDFESILNGGIISSLHNGAAHVVAVHTHTHV